ncbi:hypothetical protein BGZ63DRAFT_397352 [Mariannaea sp. PMI_226]|nr:hypothetical protein BGZ63DRAFT_397352 [Mariannaea sp. PMI_226]
MCGAEQDQMVVLHSLLIMSYWRDNSNTFEDAWHWSGLAVKLACSLGLQNSPSTALTERQKALWKRSWWTCVLRDRLVALSEQHPPRVRLDGYHVPMLTLADFNVGLRLNKSELSPGEELGKRTALSLFSIQLIRLVSFLGNDRSWANDAEGSSPTPEETWTRTQHVPSQAFLPSGFSDLDCWRVNLPEVLQQPSDSTGDDTVLPCILVHRNCLHIYYHKLILFACTRRILSATCPTELKFDSDLIHKSSFMLARLYDDLIDRDLVHCLPNDCSGSSNSAKRSLRERSAINEHSWNDNIYLTKVYASIMAGAAFAPEARSAMATSRHALSDPSGTEMLVDYNASPCPNEDSERMVTEEPNQAVKDKVLKDLTLDGVAEYLSDGSWMLDDGDSSGAVSSSFPDLSADGSSVITSDLGLLAPSTLVDFDALLSIEAAEGMKC